MDNANKAEKIAAAKKKLKHFQQRGKTKAPEILDQHPIDNDKLSTDNAEMELQSSSQVTTEFVPQSSENDVMKQIEKLKQENEELLSSYEQSQELNRKLQDEIREKMNDAEKETREIELERTISILIEEKNDLIGANQQFKGFVENLKEELKEKEESVSMMKVKLANSDMSTANVMVLKAELSTLAEERNTLKQELENRNHLYDDVCEEHTELKIRFENQMKMLNQKENTVKELSSELELLNLNMQQLKSNEVAEPSLDKTQKEQDCEKEIALLKEQLGKLSMEKDVLAQQYQQYILRLNVQLRSMSSQVESLATEKRNIEATSQINLERIAELETIITDMQKINEVSQSNPSASESEVRPEKVETVTQLYHDTEVNELQKKISEMTSDNDQLAKLILVKESRIQELEIRVDRIQNELDLISSSNNETGEREKLLQAMQNDKTAASRAIAQNRQLKMQLEELEKAFIQLSNDKLALTEQSQTALSQNKEYRDKINLIEPELIRLREQVTGLTEQRDAIIYWRQELEEAHERIEALTHQNSEMKKRVIWNLSQSPRRSTRKHNNDRSSSAESDEDDLDWVPSEEHEKLRFHYSQLEQQLKRTATTVTSLTEEKQKLEHLVLQLQSETETIGEYVSLYQVQRGLLRRRAQQLTSERLALKERTEKLIRLLPQLAPQLEKLPQWNRLAHDGVPASTGPVALEETPDIAADGVVNVLMEICSAGADACPGDVHVDNSDALHLDENLRAPHENFHPCQVCSGRLMTV